MAYNNDNHKNGKRVVTSTYADLYLEGDHCDVENPADSKQPVSISTKEHVRKGSWQSPSDNLIDLVDSLPPYTSRVLRSKTHYGILAQGENFVQDRDTFHRDLDQLFKENEAACKVILQHQIKCMMKKVHMENKVVLTKKNNIFLSETSKFYEESLQQLEDHVRSEVETVLVDLQAKIKRDYNSIILNKLEIEKKKLEKLLKEKVKYEVHKIKSYYQILRKIVLHFNNRLKNQAIIESNDTLRAFIRQMDAENITNTMYVLCEERKKCKINQFVIQNDQMSEIADMKHKLEHRLEILDDWKKWDAGICSTKSWEEKISKVMQLFLKFIGFSLKLLPEQVTFLLDLEKMVVIQLNELQKSSLTAPSILVENDNILNFEKTEPVEIQCNKKPFEIIGDLSDDVPPKYSSETIPSDVDLPFIRVGRKYIYAKCKNFGEVKALLESEQCKCPNNELQSNEEKEEFVKEQEHTENNNVSYETIQDKQPSFSENDSSLEHQPIEDIHRLENCHVRKCNLKKIKNTFSDIDAFLNYTEENFEKLKKISSKLRTSSKVRSNINPADIVFKEVPFAETKERFRNIETQYSSQESLKVETPACPCVLIGSSNASATHTKKKSISSIIQERKIMLSNLIHDHPKLLNIVFTDESYNLPF